DLFDAFAFELLAIDFDFFLRLAPDHRLVRENLQSVDHFAMAFDHASRVAPIKTHNDLRVVLLGSKLEIQLRERDHALEPRTNNFRVRRFRSLRRDLDRNVFFFVAPLRTSTRPIATLFVASLLAAISIATASAASARVTLP